MKHVTIGGIQFSKVICGTNPFYARSHFSAAKDAEFRARFDDGLLHILSINSGLLSCIIGAVGSLTIGNPVGHYRTGRQLAVKLEHPLVLQVDGNMGWESDVFSFSVLPKALRIKY